MSYRKEILKELTNKLFYFKKKPLENIEKYIYLNKGLYDKNELMSSIVEGTEIIKYSNKIFSYAEMISKTRQTVRNLILSGKIIFLPEGYYKKNELINFLITK